MELQRGESLQTDCEHAHRLTSSDRSNGGQRVSSGDAIPNGATGSGLLRSTAAYFWRSHVQAHHCAERASRNDGSQSHVDPRGDYQRHHVEHRRPGVWLETRAGGHLWRPTVSALVGACEDPSRPETGEADRRTVCRERGTGHGSGDVDSHRGLADHGAVHQRRVHGHAGWNCQNIHFVLCRHDDWLRTVAVHRVPLHGVGLLVRVSAHCDGRVHGAAVFRHLHGRRVWRTGGGPILRLQHVVDQGPRRRQLHPLAAHVERRHPGGRGQQGHRSGRRRRH